MESQKIWDIVPKRKILKQLELFKITQPIDPLVTAFF
jgi:hypothetical protein